MRLLSLLGVPGLDVFRAKIDRRILNRSLSFPRCSPRVAEIKLTATRNRYRNRGDLFRLGFFSIFFRLPTYTLPSIKRKKSDSLAVHIEGVKSPSLNFPAWTVRPHTFLGAEHVDAPPRKLMLDHNRALFAVFRLSTTWDELPVFLSAPSTWALIRKACA